MIRLLSGFLLLSSAVSAAFDPSAWAFRRQVNAVGGPFNRLDLDSDIYRISRSQLNDLRLLRSGTEVPYILRVLSGARGEELFRPIMTDRVVVPGLGAQAVLEINGHGPHNRITVVTNKTNFRQQVRIEASDDRHRWALIRSDGTIFDVSTGDQHALNLSVSYPESTARYLRVTVEGWNAPGALRSVEMSFVRVFPPQREVIADQQVNGTPDKKGRATAFDVDFGFERPFDQISFEVGAGFFSRQVTVSVSRDGKNWAAAGFGNIERTEDRERLSVRLSEAWTRYVRIAISNEDNPPLSVRHVRVEAAKRQIIFPAEQAGSYWLYSGNAKARPVEYDLGSVLPAKANLLAAKFGKVENNPSYRTPEAPITERSPWLLPTLLIVLVPALGLIAFRMLRQVNTSV